jgi:putative Mn2+ efflux pump MntP
VDLLSIILIAIGLAMDCFAVSTAQGLGSNTQKRQPKYLLMALLFGLFQGGMPLIGYYAGIVFADFFSRYAPWIALVMLATIGGKMIWESLQKKEEKDEAANWSITHLLLLAVATSIDALATGVIFIPVPDKLWLGISIIGLVSFIFSIGGYHIGRWVGRLKINVELIGGLILVGIGIKICVEGVCF